MVNWVDLITDEINTVVIKRDIGNDYDKGCLTGLIKARDILAAKGDKVDVESEFRLYSDLYKDGGLSSHRGVRDGLKMALELCR